MTHRNLAFGLAGLALLLFGLACSLSLDLPDLQGVNTIPTQTDRINVPSLPDGVARVRIDFGAGELRLDPGASDGLLEGTATYNLEGLKPDVSTTGNNVRLTSGNIRGFPDLNFDLTNRWELQFSDEPMQLRIAAGAFEGRFELGGLSLEDLHVSTGASEVDLSFSEPNQAEMRRLRYVAGASQVNLTGLANANFAQMDFDGGAGDFLLDFTGELRRDADVRIDVGLADLTLVVPEGMDVRLRIDGALAGVRVPDSFRQSGGEYLQSGSGPTLTLNVDIGAGDLDVRRP